VTEALCAWVAHPLAWVLPPEQPDDDDVLRAARAVLELVACQALSRLATDPDTLPFEVEATLRASSDRPLTLEAWAMCLDSLVRSVPDVVPWPAELPEATVAACEALGCEASAQALFAALGAGDVPAQTGPGLAALAAALRGQDTLCWIARVQPDGAATEVTLRRFVGTSHPALQTLRIDAGAPLLVPDQLVFWDGEGPPLQVPRWLAQWDATSRALRWFAGRDPTSGRPLYRRPAGLAVELPRLPDDAPPFLQDLSWGTPPPPPRLAEELGQLPADPSGATHRMAQERVAVPSSTPPPAIPEDARLIVRVLTGRYVLRYAPLHPDQPVVVGRNAQFATMVLHHHQISRAHTKIRLDSLGNVWVSDMGSTNGSQVNGRYIGRDEVRCDPGDVIGVGPLLLRVEHATPEEEERITAITSLGPSDTRDRLTRLLHPRHLVDHLPASLQASFRTGGEPPSSAPSLWGVLLYIDRLTALHAQHGEQVADATFAVAARVIQYQARNPLAVVKVAYGEVLVPVLGVDEAGARDEAQRIIDVLHDHPWEPPVRKLTMTAAIGDKEPEEDAATWLARIRKALKEGRSRRRGAVYGRDGEVSTQVST